MARYHPGVAPANRDERGTSANVRTAQGTDAAVVWPLVKAFATSFVPEEEPFSRAFAALLNDEDCAVLVASNQDESVVGYLVVHIHETLFANAPVAWIEELMVDASARGLGAGSELVMAAEAWAKNRGASYVALATRRAAGFYLALEYEESATFFRRLLDR